MEFLSQMNEIVESVDKNLFFCTFFMFWSAKVVLLIDSLWHHHHKRWEPLWVRRKSICHLFPIIKTFGSFIVLCGGYFCLPNKHKIENLLAGLGDRATAPCLDVPCSLLALAYSRRCFRMEGALHTDLWKSETNRRQN